MFIQHETSQSIRRISVAAMLVAMSFAIRPNVAHGQGACCKIGGCQELSAFDCFQISGDFKGNGIPCDPDPCDPFGACCDSSGNCEIDTEAICESSGRTYLGDNVECPDAGECMSMGGDNGDGNRNDNENDNGSGGENGSGNANENDNNNGGDNPAAPFETEACCVPDANDFAVCRDLPPDECMAMGGTIVGLECDGVVCGDTGSGVAGFPCVCAESIFSASLLTLTGLVIVRVSLSRFRRPSRRRATR